MNTAHPIRRRGSCLFQILVVLAVLALLATIAGIVSMLTSDAGSAVDNIKKSIESFVENSTSFEAPGSVQVELPTGGGIIAFTPDGTVGDKHISTPPPSVKYTITITAPGGGPVHFEANNAPRNPGAPFEVLGFFETKIDGLYTVAASTDNADDPHAAIMVAAGSQEQVQALAGSALAILQGVGGGCIAACGFITLLATGIPVLVMRKRRKQPDPLAQL